MDQGSRTLIEIVNHVMKRHPEMHSICADLLMSGLTDWIKRDYAGPSPKHIKDSVLRRCNLPDATWVETGTYHGDTTQILSQMASKVITIEPEPRLFLRAKQRFESDQSITVINDISERALPIVLPNLDGNVCFWLDGHYSAGETFAGPNDTPLVFELSAIEKHLSRFTSVSVAIDDIHLCGKRHAYGDYPSLNYLVEFATRNQLAWMIEHGIFVACSQA